MPPGKLDSPEAPIRCLLVAGKKAWTSLLTSIFSANKGNSRLPLRSHVQRLIGIEQGSGSGPTGNAERISVPQAAARLF